jgi:hypothetical protein
MSRKSVRLAVAAWFAPPNIAGLNTVFTAEPRKITDADYMAGTAAGTASGAVAYPFIEQEHETQNAFTGDSPTGKFLYYRVALVLRFCSNRKQMESAQDDFDDIVERVKARIRSDKGMGGAVWQIGQGDTHGAPDIEVVADLPKTRLKGGTGAVEIWGLVRFLVVESI